MIVKGVDLSSGLVALGETSLLNKTVNILDLFDLSSYLSCFQDKDCEEKEKIIEKEVPAKKVSKVIYGFPVIKTLFRKYTFPFKDREKIEKAVRGNLSIDLPIPIEEVEYAYVTRDAFEDDKTLVFCVIVPKDELKYFKHPVDSEIFALLRVCKNQYINNGVLIHFSPNYIFMIKFKDSFPLEVRVIKEEEAKRWVTKESSIFSGFVPEYIPKDKILLNPSKKPEYNVAYGLVLKTIDDFGVDFLHRDETKNLAKFLQGSLYLLLSFAILDISLFTYILFKEKEIKKIKSAEKEVYMKYFSSSEEIYDPLMQARGLLASVRSSISSSEDAADILNDIGKAKDISGVKEIYKINISGDTFIVQGKANSIQQIEKFKNTLAINYKTSITETVNTPQGDIRFVIKGEIK